MYVELRYYKRFDPDLIALYESGINFNDYLPDIIMAYAKGCEYHLVVPFCPACDLNERKLIHTRVKIKDSASIELLKKVKIGYRNTFCKLLIRNALVRQSFGVFFSDPSLIEKENISVKYRREVLAGDVAERLKQECIRLIEGMDGHVIEIETDADHVHILADLSPTRSITDQINVLKGVTARMIRRDCWEEVSQKLWGSSLWSESYYIATAGGVTIERLEEYVKSQPTNEHHRKYVKSGKYSNYPAKYKKRADSSTP